ncbi:MAG TPA: phosphatidate cytidylyltransferase, partial [Herpetosiphonaceae bacterium]
MLQRIVSALVLAPVVLALVWLGGWWTAGLLAAAVAIGIREIVAIFQAGGLHPRRLVALAIGLGFVVSAIVRSRTGADLTGAVLAVGAIGALLAEIARRDRAGALEGWAVSLAGAVYAGWLLSHFILLREFNFLPLRPSPLSGLGLEPGAGWVFAAFAVTWAADTGAYFAGRAFGKHKMAPTISPKKTWEGFAGSVAAAVIAGVLLA